MKTQGLLCALLSILGTLAAGTIGSAVTVSWVTVGDPGNAADTSGYGAVADAFAIAATEVTNAQYAEFLNTVDSLGANALGLYNPDMGTNARGGITFASGNAPGTKYVLKTDMSSKPVNFMSWFDAARFTNWMNNGQGAGSTETGAYDVSQANPTRLAGATIFMPTEHEWYKAAYYDPVNAGADAGGTPDYWLYPTMSDAIPTIATADANGDITNPGANVANYNSGADWNTQDGNVTTVGGAGALSASYYGTFDQGGNLWEWTETIYDPNPIAKVIRGGGWNFPELGLGSTYRDALNPLVGDGIGDTLGLTGFRLATIPEPSRALLMLLGLQVLLLARKRF